MDRRSVYSNLNRTPEADLYRSQVSYSRSTDRMAQEAISSQSSAVRISDQTSRYKDRRESEATHLKEEYERKYGTPWLTAVRRGDPMPDKYRPAPEKSGAHLKKYVKPSSAHSAQREAERYHKTYTGFESARDTYDRRQVEAERWSKHEDHRLSREERLYNAGYKSAPSSSSSRFYSQRR